MKVSRIQFFNQKKWMSLLIRDVRSRVLAPWKIKPQFNNGCAFITPLTYHGMIFFFFCSGKTFINAAVQQQGLLFIQPIRNWLFHVLLQILLTLSPVTWKLKKAILGIFWNFLKISLHTSSFLPLAFGTVLNTPECPAARFCVLEFCSLCAERRYIHQLGSLTPPPAR